MKNMNARTQHSDSSAISLNLELAHLEEALRGAALLAELLANHGLPDEETQRMVPHCIAAQLALVNARLRQVGRVIRGEEDAEALWAPHNATSSSPLPGDDGDVRLLSHAPPRIARRTQKAVERRPRVKQAIKRTRKAPKVEEAPTALSASATA